LACLVSEVLQAAKAKHESVRKRDEQARFLLAVFVSSWNQDRSKKENSMAVDLEPMGEGKTLVVRVTGKFGKQDHEQFAPAVEQLANKHGKIRVLFEAQDFQGWDADALWEDVEFAAEHYNDIERMAMVGEKKWHAGMATFCKPFTEATVRYFDQSETKQAKDWVTSK
jgi:hypothetical protein